MDATHNNDGEIMEIHLRWIRFPNTGATVIACIVGVDEKVVAENPKLGWPYNSSAQI